MRGLTPPSLAQLEQYNVNVDGQPEVIWQPLYDYQVYAAAGFTSQRFFNVPAGQAGKTFDDTNLETAGVLPVPQNMAITSVEVVFFPGNVIGSQGVRFAPNIAMGEYLDPGMGYYGAGLDPSMGEYLTPGIGQIPGSGIEVGDQFTQGTPYMNGMGTTWPTQVEEESGEYDYA